MHKHKAYFSGGKRSERKSLENCSLLIP